MKFWILGFGLFLVVSGSVLTVPKTVEKNTETRNDGEPDWWENAVFYQIYPRSFFDHDDNGVGDLRGITLRLPHLKEAGVTGIWMSPVFLSPMVDFGYDIQSFYEIDPTFGTMEDLEFMLFEAKRLNLRVVLDFVPNHSSDQAEWFQRSVAAVDETDEYWDYYVWKDSIGTDANGDPIPPNNWVSVFQGSAWTWNSVRNQFYLHQFTKEQPDLNYRNDKVVEEMTNVLKFWLNKGVDGFRVDAINHMFEDESFQDDPPLPNIENPYLYEHFDHINTRDLPESYQIVYNWRQLIDSYEGDTRVLMTEAYASIENTMLWYGSADGTQKGSHIPFNFLMISDWEEGFNANTLKDTINLWMDNMPEGQNANWVLGNHDRPRVGSRFGEEYIDLMNTLVMTLPGIAFSYYGEEIGMVDYRDISFEDTQDPQGCGVGEELYQLYSRDPVRTPFQWNDQLNTGFSNSLTGTWLPVHTNYKEKNLQLQKSQEKSTFSVYKELTSVRKNPQFQGTFEIEAVTNNVLSYKRAKEGEEDDFVVALNIGESEATVNLVEAFEKLGPSGIIEVSGEKSTHETGETVEMTTLKLGAYDSLVIRVRSGAGAIHLSVATMLIVLFRHAYQQMA